VFKTLWRKIEAWFEEDRRRAREKRHCWNCAFYKRPAFEMGECGLQNVWFKSIFGGEKKYRGDTLRFKDHVCSSFEMVWRED